MLIICAFVGIVHVFLIYMLTQFIDAALISQLIAGIQANLQEKGLDEASIATVVRLLQQYVTPSFLLMTTLVGTVLVGFVFTLVIAAYTRHSKTGRGDAVSSS